MPDPCGHTTVSEAIDYARNPPIFWHSSPAGALDRPRNVPDQLLRACADKGGVIGLSGFGPFLGDGDPVGNLVMQLRCAIDLVGPAHVGLGLDYVFDRPNRRMGQCQIGRQATRPDDQ
ncbi:hypothetical protein CMV14_16410 [Rhizorhabdus dicambivorans]|nr:hypothetical protein CMV14_16410 [Rhizorhabdus dicambivorans]